MLLSSGQGSEEKCRSGILYIIESRREKIIPSIYFETDRKQEVWVIFEMTTSFEYFLSSNLSNKFSNIFALQLSAIY